MTSLVDETLADYRIKLRNFLGANFYISDANSMKDGSSLLDEGIIDSTGVLEVIGFLETAFDIQVADHEITPDNLDSIERIARFVSMKKTQGA